MKRRPHGTGSLKLRGRIWWIKYYHQGKPVQESSKSDKKSDAERLLRVRLGDEVAGRATNPAKITILEICRLTENDYRITKKKSLRDVTYRIEKTLAPMLGHLQAKSFGSEQAMAFIDARRKQNVEDSTINRELAIVRRGFTLAMRERPPLLNSIPYIPKLREENVREGFVEHSDYLKIREAMADQLKALFVVAYHVGMRLGELRKLEWSWIDWEACEIKIPRPRTKNKQPRTVPIYGDMLPFLIQQKAVRDEKWPACPYVFFWHGKPIGHRTKGWVRSVKAAGFPALRPHDLRRSAVRNMERAGIPRKLAMEISGHRTESVYRRYDITSKNDMAIVKAKMVDFFENRQPAPSPQKQNGDNMGTAGRVN
jgi:integrase